MPADPGWPSWMCARATPPCHALQKLWPTCMAGTRTSAGARAHLTGHGTAAGCTTHVEDEGSVGKVTASVSLVGGALNAVCSAFIKCRLQISGKPAHRLHTGFTEGDGIACAAYRRAEVEAARDFLYNNFTPGPQVSHVVPLWWNMAITYHNVHSCFGTRYLGRIHALDAARKSKLLLLQCRRLLIH